MRTFLITFIFSISAFAAEVYNVEVDIAKVYRQPKENSVVATNLKKGKKIKIVSEKDGFGQIKTKSGKSLWIKMSDLNVPKEDIVDVEEDKPAAKAKSDFKRFTFDLGMSFGGGSGFSYQEANLGVNFFILEWLAWRNGAFARFQSPLATEYGWDSSMRAYLRLSMSQAAKITAFGGAGYRIVGGSAPFTDVGIVANLFGFSIGGGAKFLFANGGTDTQYFLVLSGGG